MWGQDMVAETDSWRWTRGETQCCAGVVVPNKANHFGWTLLQETMVANCVQNDRLQLCKHCGLCCKPWSFIRHQAAALPQKTLQPSLTSHTIFKIYTHTHFTTVELQAELPLVAEGTQWHSQPGTEEIQQLDHHQMRVEHGAWGR